MKFGVLTYARNRRMNIGDNVMSMGILNIYKKMGIRDEDIVPVYYNVEIEEEIANRYLGQEYPYKFKYSLCDYDADDYVLLPITAFMDYDIGKEKFYTLNPKIIQIFMGINAISHDGFQ